MATPWDAVFKEIFARWLERLGAKVQTEVEVVRLPRTVDMATTTDAAVRARLAAVSPFDYFRAHNLLEFKSPRDPLTPAEYKLILARAFLFLNEVGEDDLRRVTVTIVSATKPRRVLREVPYLVKFQKEGAGRYRSDEKLPLYVLVASELQVKERNYPSTVVHGQTEAPRCAARPGSTWRNRVLAGCIRIVSAGRFGGNGCE